MCQIIYFIVNYLLQAKQRVVNLFEDLRDGNSLISLLEVLSQEPLVSVARTKHKHWNLCKSIVVTASLM